MSYYWQLSNTREEVDLLMAVNRALHLITPRIFRIGLRSTIHIPRQWFEVTECTPPATVVVSNVSGHPQQTAVQMPDQVTLEESNSGYVLTYNFPNEGEYLILVDTPSGIKTISLYALNDDLFLRRPYRGDVHMHSNQSDGREDPPYVAAACRRIGLDFMAVTDHWRYTPSLEAIEAFKGVPVDLQIFPGEEVHVPPIPVRHNFRHVTNPIHIVNFGGKFSINEWITKHELVFHAEVKMIMNLLTDFPSDLNKRTYAECVWCFDKIREAGGLGIFCHPYWINNYKYDVPETLTNLLFERQPYDALELIGGYRRWEAISNHLQVARYHEERSNGKRIPIIGVSDAHGCEKGELFGWYTTLVFSPSLSFSDIKLSIMDLYSVAVEAVPWNDALAHGPFRLVKYAQFLMREIFPTHNAMCYEEGMQMIEYINGKEEAQSKLQEWQGRTAEYYNMIFDATT
jgi:hypothetical protein